MWNAMSVMEYIRTGAFRVLPWLIEKVAKDAAEYNELK